MTPYGIFFPLWHIEVKAYCTVYARVPVWDLVMVLKELPQAPFEPIGTISEKFLTLKMGFVAFFSW